MADALLVPLTAACLQAAASMYQIPVEVLHAIRLEEAGQVGRVSVNRNKSHDLGPFQVNSLWLDTFTVYWRLPDRNTTYYTLRDNGCWNAAAAAAILRLYWHQAGDLSKAIHNYHSKTPALGQAYLARVLKRMYPQAEKPKRQPRPRE